MIVQLKSTEIIEPRISLQHLGRIFVCFPEKENRHPARPEVSPIRGGRLTTDPPFTACSVPSSMGLFRKTCCATRRRSSAGTRVRNPEETKRRRANVQAIEKLVAMGEEANPPPGTHRIVCQNARLSLGGVVISAGPDIVTGKCARGPFRAHETAPRPRRRFRCGGNHAAGPTPLRPAPKLRGPDVQPEPNAVDRLPRADRYLWRRSGPPPPPAIAPVPAGDRRALATRA